MCEDIRVTRVDNEDDCELGRDRTDHDSVLDATNGQRIPPGW